MAELPTPPSIGGEAAIPSHSRVIRVGEEDDTSTLVVMRLIHGASRTAPVILLISKTTWSASDRSIIHGVFCSPPSRSPGGRRGGRVFQAETQASHHMVSHHAPPWSPLATVHTTVPVTTFTWKHIKGA